MKGTYWDTQASARKRGHPPDETDLIDKDVTRLQWRLNSIQRNLFQALERLKALQANREPPRQTQDPKPLNPQLASFGSASAAPDPLAGQNGPAGEIDSSTEAMHTCEKEPH